ncbi:MAG TPA: NUDIX domain-containing protein [Chloroflexota bacterium]|jgi:8-oxo-dGTP pyrophosphatase MutT (NUDIX family)|nr:NUDIX domain-containing protein [Chloroflexota bacterium]
MLDKVTGFVTRGQELLVFLHPRAGVQLPAGTVEPGESVQAAVLREVREEAGLDDLRIVGLLDTFPETPPPGWAACTRRVWVRSGPGRGTRVPLWCRRGTPARVLERRGAHVRIAGQGSDLVGWVPADALTSDLRRHLFHLVPLGPTRHTWTTRTDRHRFRLYWVPLTDDPGLVPGQAAWLDRVRHRLLAHRSE